MKTNVKKALRDQNTSQVKCWEVFQCNKKKCPAYKSKNHMCWLFTGTHCRDEVQGKFIEKIELCLDCEVFQQNSDPATIRSTLKAVNKQFKEYGRIISQRDKELQGMSMELALGLSEVFEALKKISMGDPRVRISETSKIELISKLKHFVNLTAQEIGEIVDQSHEIAIGLAEHFDVLHKVSMGNLQARVAAGSDVELLQSLEKVTNETIESIYREINERKRMEDALKQAHDNLETRVKERTAELVTSNEKLQEEFIERLKAEEALRKSEEHHRTLIETMNEGLSMVDKDGIITFVNDQFCSMTGYAKDELIGSYEKTLLDKENQKIFRRHWSRRKKGDASPYEITLTKKQGGKLHAYISPKPLFDDSGDFSGSFGIFTDITERKQAEEKLYHYQEQLRSLASELSLVEERQRRCIATELNDYISQALYYCKNKLEMLKETKTIQDCSTSTDEIVNLIEQIIQYTKSLTFQLGTPILYEEGLEAALKWLGYQFQKQVGLIFHFEDDLKPKPLADETIILLYQAVRELLINVTRHAKAKNARVSIERDYKHVHIQVEDDGIGFDTTKINPYKTETSGFGLFSIHERLKFLGGEFKLISKPGVGTRASLIVPMKPVKKSLRP
jgi:PAS domain S-box-containing protein